MPREAENDAPKATRERACRAVHPKRITEPVSY